MESSPFNLLTLHTIYVALTFTSPILTLRRVLASDTDTTLMHVVSLNH